MLVTDSGAALMASDVPETMGPPVAMGQVYHEAPNLEAAPFGALVQGGRDVMPFGETFWSPGYGILVDRFGLQWAVSAPDPVKG